MPEGKCSKRLPEIFVLMLILLFPKSQTPSISRWKRCCLANELMYSHHPRRATLSLSLRHCGLFPKRHRILSINCVRNFSPWTVVLNHRAFRCTEYYPTSTALWLTYQPILTLLVWSAQANPLQPLTIKSLEAKPVTDTYPRNQILETDTFPTTRYKMWIMFYQHFWC